MLKHNNKLLLNKYIAEKLADDFWRNATCDPNENHGLAGIYCWKITMNNRLLKLREKDNSEK